METGWVVSIVLGVALLVVIVAVVIWVVMRRRAFKEENANPSDSSETIQEHESHSVSTAANDRWNALLQSWEKEHLYTTNKDGR